MPAASTWLVPSSTPAPPAPARATGGRRLAVRPDHPMVTIDRSTLLDGPVDRCFDLSLSIDAHLASMGASGERAVDGVTEGLIGLSETVTWRARHFGVTWQMTNQIVEWERPLWFVDEQIRGPFASFRHEHGFRDVAGRTQMTDRVTFAAPFGALGRFIERAVLTRKVARLIDARNAFLAAEIASDRP